MKPNYRARRLVALLILTIVSLTALAVNLEGYEVLPQVGMPSDTTTESSTQHDVPATTPAQAEPSEALTALGQLLVKGRAPKTGYERTQFGNGWQKAGGCDLRNIILRRDLSEPRINEKCQVISGVLDDPYTGETIRFTRGESSSADVQIDHVVALSNAWQTGAQQLSRVQRISFANDPLNLIAVDGKANQEKSDGDAASWLPANKAFRCQYVARQVAVKTAYGLWVTVAERDAMRTVLEKCPNQKLPSH